MAELNKKIMTLSIIYNHPKILLGMKKRGFGKGKWNGFGGKVEPEESIEEAALRELKEEAGISAREIEKRGIIDFSFKNTEKDLEVHIFCTGEVIGEPRETEEMSPKWFYLDEIPFKEMWPDDVYWFPLFLKNRKFKASFVFDSKGENILDKEIKVVESLEREEIE